MTQQAQKPGRWRSWRGEPLSVKDGLKAQVELGFAEKSPVLMAELNLSAEVSDKQFLVYHPLCNFFVAVNSGIEWLGTG